MFISGTAEVLWNHPQQAQLKGAERVVEVTVETSVLLTGYLDFKSVFIEESANLKTTNVWGELK